MGYTSDSPRLTVTSVLRHNVGRRNTCTCSLLMKKLVLSSNLYDVPVVSGLPKAKDICVYVNYSGNLFEPGVLKLRLVMKTLKGQRELLQASRNLIIIFQF